MPDLASSLASLTGGGGGAGLSLPDASGGGAGGGLQDLLGGLSFAQISSDHALAANPVQGLMLAQTGSLSQTPPAPNPQTQGKDEDGFDDEIFILDGNANDNGMKDALQYDPLSSQAPKMSIDN